MKYLLPLLFLVGCETFPEKRYEDQLLEEAHFMEQTTEGDTCIDDSIKTEPSNTEPELGGFDFFLEDPIDSIEDMEVWNLAPVYYTIEIDVSFFTHRRYMVYINVIRS